MKINEEELENEKENELVICDNVVLGNHLEELYVTTCMIPEGITCIADYAFEGTDMNELELPKSLRYVGKYSFSGRSYSSHDSKVKELNLKNVVSIDNGTFQYWHYIDSVDLSNVTYLGGNAFYWCNALSFVKLEENMDYIGESAFSDCKKLETIKVPKCVESVDINSFSCGGTANRAFSQFNPTETIGSITIPESVKYIGDIWLGLRDIKDVQYFQMLKFIMQRAVQQIFRIVQSLWDIPKQNIRKKKRNLTLRLQIQME